MTDKKMKSSAQRVYLVNSSVWVIFGYLGVRPHHLGTLILNSKTSFLMMTHHKWITGKTKIWLGF